VKTKIYLVIIVLVMGSILIHKKTSGHVNISVNGPGSLTGKIVEEVSTLPLEMVNVVLFSATDSSMVVGTISNMDGSFSISRIKSGIYFLELSCPGFEKTRINQIQIPKENTRICFDKICIHKISETRKKQNSIFAKN
jgi:hypothetical protein